MRKITAMVIMIVMILPVLCVLSVNDTKAENVKADVGSGEFVPVTLYFHNESNLDTKAPTTNNSTTTELEDAEAVVFRTDSLDKDLYVNTTQCFRVAFNITVYVRPALFDDRIILNLTIIVLEDNTECAKVTLPPETFYEGSVQWEVDETLAFNNDWDFKFDDRDEIKVKITPEIDPIDGLEGTGVDYTVEMEYDHEDRLGVLDNIYCAPVEIDVSAYNKNNNPETEFMPNLAAEDCIIKFRSSKSGEDSIKNAFGDDDIVEVNIEITGPNGFYCKPENNITENRTKEELYKWDYSDYSSQFVAGIPYTATITVETIQHMFTQTTSFNFSAYGLEAEIDNPHDEVPPSETASDTVSVGNQTDYTITIRNTGSYDKSDTVSVRLDIELSPYGLHSWNITFGDKSANVSGYGIYFTCEIMNFYGGAEEDLTLTVKSLNASGEIKENWYCRTDITVKFIHHDEIPSMTLYSKTYLSPPHKIDITWAETYTDPYYVLVNVPHSLYITVTNMGSLQDTVNLTLDYTNEDVWDITFKNGQENTTTEKLNPYRYILGDYEEEVELIIIVSSEGENEVTTSVNITACSQGNKSVRDYLTLNLSRAFGITMDVELKGTGEVDVEDSDGEAIYEVSIKTNDNTTHTVDLNAVCDNENVELSFDDGSVEVSKDSPKNVTLTVTCPKGMMAGSYTITVNASIRGAPVSKHNKTANVIVTVNEYYALSVVWAESNKNNITVTAAPSEYFYRTLRVTNKGNSNISVSIDPVNVHDFQLFDSAVPSQFSLSYGEEKNVTIYLYIPKDARDGDIFVVYMETSSGAGSPKSAVITIEIKQDIWEKLIATLYSMIYFIILLIAVVVVFISVWVKKKKMR